MRLILIALFAASLAVSAEHRVQFVDVAEGVKLEVVDWGGEGHGLVFLAGSGHSAHVFDEFAPKFAGRWHVYGITRRGYGASSHPASGYDAERLGADVAAVLDFLHLERPVLVGHSLGGKELTAVATAHPDRLGGLIYMDSTADPTFDWKPYEALQKKLPPAAQPAVAPEQARTSAKAYIEWQRRNRGFAFPECEIPAIFHMNPDGSMGRHKTPAHVAGDIFAGMRKPDYSRIRVPVLAFFSLPGPVEEQLKRYKIESAEQKAAVEQTHAIETDFAKRAIRMMRDAQPKARVVEMPGANHYIFFSNEAEVLGAMREFLNGLR